MDAMDVKQAYLASDSRTKILNWIAIEDIWENLHSQKTLLAYSCKPTSKIQKPKSKFNLYWL